MHSLSNPPSGNHTDLRQHPGMVLATVLFAVTMLLLMFGSIAPASASRTADASGQGLATNVNLASLAARPAAVPVAAAPKLVKVADTGMGAVTTSRVASQSRIAFRRGFSVQRAFGRTWLVYGWPNGIWHATTRFYRNSRGLLISRTPFVPSQTSRSSVAAAPRRVSSLGRGSVSLGARHEPHGILRGHFHGDGYLFGQCTDGAYMLAHHQMLRMGNAGDWDNTARARHYPVGFTPRVGATVVFERGVDGASRRYGHVAHVIRVSGRRFEIEEMNGTAGPGRFDFRWVNMVRGVSFIYL